MASLEEERAIIRLLPIAGALRAIERCLSVFGAATLLTLAGPANASAGPLSVGAHTFVNDRQAQGASPMTTPAVITQTTGSSFVVFVGSLAPQGTISDSKQNTFRQLGSWINYASGQGNFSAYTCVACAGGPNHTFSFNKPAGGATSEATLFAVEVRGSPSVDTFIQADSLTNPINAGNLTTTRPGDLLLVAALGDSFGAPDTYTPSAGYTLLDQQTNGGDSMAGADAFEIAGPPGVYGGTLASSLTTNPAGGSAIFLVALGRTPVHAGASLGPAGVAFFIASVGGCVLLRSRRRAPAARSAS
jgi:hypothetical protein